MSLKRLNDFLNADEVDKSAIGKQVDDQSNAIEAKNASFMWDADHHIPTLNNLSFSVKKGSCIAIVGKVGSGKSSILSALIGDMVKAGGRVNVNGSVAYVPQQAWIQNATLKYNVIFGQKMSPAVYRKARCLKITEKISFNIASEASYVYILSGQKLIKNAKNAQFGEFLKT